MKRFLQTIIAVLSLLPLLVGILGFIYGAGLFLPEGTATPRLDSQYRFMSAWDIGLAVIVWWIIPRIEYETALFRIVSAAVFLGGVGRLVACYTTGSPGLAFLAVMVLELLVPLLVPWQAKLAQQAQAASAGGPSQSSTKQNAA